MKTIEQLLKAKGQEIWSVSPRTSKARPSSSRGRVVGIVTLGDVVKRILSEQEFRIQELEKYVTGG